VPRLALEFVRATGGFGAERKSSILTHELRASAVDAAFVNATLVNAASRDDFLAKSHPAALTLPAALAIADERGGTGADLITALVVGYEITGRAYLGGPAMLPRFRASGVAGTVGAAATAAKMLRLDEAQLVNALGCSAVFAHGFGAGFLAGTQEVKLNVGMACRSGVSAALLAECGANASPVAFEGRSGYYEAFAGSMDAEAAVAQLGERFLIEDVVYKERPVCIFTQTPLELATRLASEVDAARIDRVRVTAPDLTYTNPGFTNEGPYTTALQALVSARFCVAGGLLGRPVDTQAFYGHGDDAEVLALASRIDLQVGSPDDGDLVRIEVQAGGRTHTASAIEGETLRPSPQRIEAKFRRLCGDLGAARVEQIVDTVRNIDRLGDVRLLTKLISAPSGAGSR